MISRISRRLSTHIRARTHTSIHNRTLSLNSNLIKAAENDPASYCKEHVRKHDYESFLTGQFYPRDIQAVYFALRAFYVRVFFCYYFYSLCKCTLSWYLGRTSDDPRHGLGIYAWEDEDAVLARHYQTNIRCMCVNGRTYCYYY